MKYKVGIISLGCDKNLVDTEIMLGLLNKNDFIITNSEKNADILIVNTCAFIKSAVKESFDAIKEMAKVKSLGKCKLLIVTGCLAQRYKEEIFKKIPEVDAVVGTGSYHEIVDVINEALNKNKIIKLGDISKIYDIKERIQSTPFYTSYLKIAEGCSNYCSYCIIPKIRGKFRSRPVANVLDEAKMLVNRGVKELIVIAQDTTKYGLDLYNKKMLPELLNRLCELENLRWIRIMYCYPEGIDDELLSVIKKQDKICNYLDMPIQHSNDKILKLMGRRSTRKNLINLIQKIRKVIPDITIRTSLIVGFPGEGEAEFNDLLDFVKQMKLNRVGTFMYSREEGTAAANFENQVPEKIKKQRMDTLMKLQQQISLNNNLNLIGKKLEVLVEGSYEQNSYIGRTYMDAPEVDGKVYFYSKHKLNPGTFVNVLIKNVNEYDLSGEIVK